MSAASNGAQPNPPSGSSEQIVVKPGRHREASLYHALAGAGAGDGRTLAELREAALSAFARSELPVWRRSGFWTTSFAELDEALLATREQPGEDWKAVSREHPRGAGVPDFVRDAIPDRDRAGRIVQLDSSIVHVELDPKLAERGVILCSLEDAAREHEELFAKWYSKRLTIDRHKLEAANAAFWSGGAFLYVPDGLLVEDPFEIVYAIGGPGVAQYGRTLVIGGRSSDFRVHEHNLAADFGDASETTGGDTYGGEQAQSLHAGAFEMYLQDNARCRLAQVQDWSLPRSRHDGGHAGQVFDASTRFVGVGRDAYCHWLPALLGGHLVRHHLELAVSEPGGDMAFRGLFFTEAEEHLDTFAVDLHETGPSGGDVHWRGAATGSSRASFEGLIQIDPGAQKTHTYLQIHTLMLSPKARLDAIPSVLVSADDVSASHGGTVGELDEASIFYMASRGLDRPSAVRLLVEGFFEPLLGQLEDEPLEELVRTKIAAKLAAARDDIEAYATAR
ncbi:MAG TPA: SufD family Fe-S cluster assembly protein [Solirubrobacteraceae bacterium]|jgi:Fe-S cluster assembly scaffold protein SufB|nr:SufD family Fe-S cluster assembly protein [Solirubrobacteraceae bacterium]